MSYFGQDYSAALLILVGFNLLIVSSLLFIRYQKFAFWHINKKEIVENLERK